MGVLDPPGGLPVRPSGILRAVINVTTTGDQPIIAGVGGKQMIVIGCVLTVDGATTLTWKSNTTALSGDMTFVGGGGMVLPISPHLIGYFETAVAATLNINSLNAVNVKGHLTYIQV